MKIKSLSLIVFLSICFLFPTETLACACCSEHGTYSLWTGKTGTYNIDLLQEIKFDNVAFLYMTSAGFDGMKGLKGLEKDFISESWTDAPADFTLSAAFAAKTWKFDFKTPTGKTGVLTLPMPAQMQQFKVDIHDGKMSGGGGPLLYKEWRFKGTVSSGTGIFKSSIIRPTTYQLVLQGRGNACDNAEDFTSWLLEINGRKASYQFFAKLISGANSEDEVEEKK
jgi:hypothetical protein